MVSAQPRHLDLFKQALLERLEPDLDRTQRRRRLRAFGAGGELRGIERNEVAALPVRVEDAADLLEHVGVALAGDAQVPFQPGVLGLMREVRRPDERRRRAGLAVEQPGLGVQSGVGDVVGDPNLRAEVGEVAQRLELGATGVGGGEDAQGLALSAVPLQRSAQGVESTAADERHHQVDGIRRCDLRIDLADQPGLAG